MWNRDIIGSFVNFCSVFASENGPATGVQPSLDLNKRWSVPWFGNALEASAICCYSTSGHCCSFGFDLGDGLPPVLDLRFADDILISAKSSHEIMTLLDKLLQFLGDAGLKLNAEKPC